MFGIRCRRLTLALVCLTAACAEPPTKELSQAEGALRAARAAGAALYASAEFAAAEATLARAHTDVTARDYRAALGHALDASAKAQAAAGAAVEGRVKARLAADQTLDDFSVLIEETDAALATPEAKRVPAATRRRVAATVSAAADALRDARAAVEHDDMALLVPLAEHTAALHAALDSLAPPAPAPKTRARS
ncbi:MAG: hypothetical protein ABI880_16155 [Acidobacteriota bacterium]